MLNRVEYWHNRASDTNFVWFPFLFLKLKPEEKLTFTHALKMTLLFGPYFALYNFLRLSLLGDSPGWESLELSTIKFTAFFFVWFNCVTRFFWNRRVNRLKEI